jgi:spore maturation protein CgeB
VDETVYFPRSTPTTWQLGYLGTYSEDRQPALERLLLEPARRCPDLRFAVAGSMYPGDIAWPENVQRFDHLPPGKHRNFYGAQKFALNLTRGDMLRAGYSPSVRLFEAAACGTCLISDLWPGLDEFFQPGKEILVGSSEEDVISYMRQMSDRERERIASAARERVLARHTAVCRAAELVEHFHRTSRSKRRTQQAGTVQPQT